VRARLRSRHRALTELDLFPESSLAYHGLASEARSTACAVFSTRSHFVSI
jgi:hypothetical protein